MSGRMSTRKEKCQYFAVSFLPVLFVVIVFNIAGLTKYWPKIKKKCVYKLYLCLPYLGD